MELRGVVRLPQVFFSSGAMACSAPKPVLATQLQPLVASAFRDIDYRKTPSGMTDSDAQVRKGEIKQKLRSLAEKVDAAFPEKPEYVVLACWFAARKICLLAPSCLDALEKKIASPKEFSALMGALDKAMGCQAGDFKLHMMTRFLSLVGAMAELYQNDAPRLEIAPSDLEAVRKYYLESDVIDPANPH